MRTVAILPVKSFGRAKTRLGTAFADRPSLAAAMVADVLDALAQVPALDEVIVVTAEPSAAEAARAAGARVVHDPAETGQSDAAALGIAAAVGHDMPTTGAGPTGDAVPGARPGGGDAPGAGPAGDAVPGARPAGDDAPGAGLTGDGAGRVLLVPGDCPALDPDQVSALLAHDAPVVIVPDRHGTGTNALLLTPPDVMRPAFGEGSFARHTKLARAAGVDPVTAHVPSLGLDVDTPDDLAALRRALAGEPERAVRTRALLEAAALAR